MKKLIAIMLVITIGAVMSACGNQKEDSGDESSSISMTSRQEPSQSQQEVTPTNPSETIEPDIKNPAASVDGAENPTGNPAAGIDGAEMENPPSVSYPSDQKAITAPYGMDSYSLKDMIIAASVESAAQISYITVSSSSAETVYSDASSVETIFTTLGNVMIDGVNPGYGDAGTGAIVVKIVFKDKTIGRFDLMADYMYVNGNIGPYAYLEGSGYAALTQYAKKS